MSTRDQKNIYVPPHRRVPRENSHWSGSIRAKHIPHLCAHTNSDDPSEMSSDTNFARPQTARNCIPVTQTPHAGTNDLGSNHMATVSSSTDRSTFGRSLNPIPEPHTQIATSIKRKRKIRAYPELQNLHQEALAERSKDSGLEQVAHLDIRDVHLSPTQTGNRSTYHLPALLPFQDKKSAGYTVPKSILKGSVITDTEDDRALKAHEKRVPSSSHDEDLVDAMQGLKVFSNLRAGVQTLGMNSKHISDENLHQKQRDHHSSGPLEGRAPTIVDNGQVGGHAIPVSTNTDDMIFSNTPAATRAGTIGKDSIRDVIVDTEHSFKQFAEQIPASLTALANTDALTTKVAIGGDKYVHPESLSLDHESTRKFGSVAYKDAAHSEGNDGQEGQLSQAAREDSLLPVNLASPLEHRTVVSLHTIRGSEDEDSGLEQGSEDDFEVVTSQNCQSQRNGRPNMWGRWFE